MSNTAILKTRPSTIIDGEIVITVQVDGVLYERLDAEQSQASIEKIRLRKWYRDRGYEVIG